MFVGDFNRNLCIDNDDKVDNCKRDFTMALRQGQFPELKVVAAPRTCVYFADTGLEIQTRDGAVVSNSMGNPEVLTLWQMNRVDILTTKLGVSYAAEAQVTPEIVAALSLAHKKPLSDVVMSQEIPALPMFDAGTVSQNVLDGSIGSDTHDSTTGGQQKRMRKSMAGDESRASDESPAVAGLNQFFPPVAAASSISSGHQAQANF